MMRFQKVLTVGTVLIVIFAVLWMLVCALLEERIPNSLTLKNGYTFDYVVVGGGTAGSVLTSLLAKHSNSTVLLIEAGGAFGFLSKIPLLTTFQQQGINDWTFLSVPQKHSSKGLEGAQQCLPRGKGLGGSAQLNYMLHFGGHPADFDFWHKNNNLSDWNWKSIEPFVKAASGKPFEMFEVPRSYSKLTAALSDAEVEFSHKPWIFRRSRYEVKNGLRHSVLHRFLKPAFKSRNLRVLTNALVKKIQFSEDKAKVISVAVGIKDESSRKEQLFSITIRRELILCAGAYQTPQLLLASGIGDKLTLSKLKIPVQHHLPFVGKGLHDHFNMPLFVTIDVVGPTLNQNALLDPLSFFNYLTSGNGHLGNFGVMGHVSMYTEPSFTLTFFAAGAIDESALMSISNFKRHAFRALFPRYHNTSQEGFVLISNCLQPKSRGSVTLASDNMRKNPLINPNYLSEPTDVHCTIKAIRTAVELVNSASFQKLRPRIQWPKLRECAQLGPFERDFVDNKPSDDYLECIMRHLGLSSHHPGGTSVMGTDPSNSVVDSKLRVHGVQNLRVVDASVLPTPISGNPNAVVAGIALRAASWLLKDEFRAKSTDL